MGSPGHVAATPEITVVVLSQGDRPVELRAALRSIRDQQGVSCEVVVVWNGPAESDRLPDGLCDREITLATNVGIPEGRNVGARAASGPLIAFLDDDATYGHRRVLAEVRRRFEADRTLGIIACRIADEHGHTSRRHVPRCGGRSARRPGPVTAFLGGASIVRRSMFEQVGGFAGEFFYSLEETDLAWRALDAGWTARYEPDLVVQHPRTDPTRHPGAIGSTARNRVWLAHRSLPLPLAVVYVADWALIDAVRHRRRPAEIRAMLHSMRDGWRTRPGPRHPMSWSTAWAMTRLGRPPVI